MLDLPPLDVPAVCGADIAVGMRYADAMTWDGCDNSMADMRQLSDIEADVPTPADHYA